MAPPTRPTGPPRADGGSRTVADAQYGDGVNNETVQAAGQSASRSAPQPGRTPQPAVAPPGSLTPLTAPTERQGEPLTAGLPMGEGPGPGQQVAYDDDLFELRAVAQRFPSRDFLRLIQIAEARK